ncbi:InlB B-repeat-containing protein [Candidatus Haliotispira prima]|uniref:InlB B-repeat-containing protein n=1 Tax=Candidatus Haliotispira prima TaxID=3034016 RepID=A0ABY8MK46_9SPIO|nr:InlB B-repeat-containing protein [Candidatus Haliotispira prima]
MLTCVPLTDTGDPPASTSTFTITFNSQGGTEVASQTIASGNKSSKPTDPAKAGFVFGGWHKEQTLATLFNFTQETITGDLTLYAKWKKLTLNTSMAWVSMREGLVQFDNGTPNDTPNNTQRLKTIGVIVSKDAAAPAYTGVKDLPGFYTRETKADGTPRTVYLSMTDKMTSAKFNAGITVSVDGSATGFVSPIAAAPELLHPNTDYYAHFYDIAGATGTAIEKLAFTTENFPATYPTTRGTYSSFYNQVTAGSTSPAIEYKASESYLIPARFHYFLTIGGSYLLRFSLNPTITISETGTNTRPFGNPVPGLLIYDLYNIAASGPGTSVGLWDTMIKTANLSFSCTIDHAFGSHQFTFYENNKAVLVTE